MITEKINTGKGLLDWYLSKKSANQALIILLLLLSYLGYQYFVAQGDLKVKVIDLEKTVKKQDSIINVQNIEILKLKYRTISTEDYDKYDSNPRWITDAETQAESDIYNADINELMDALWTV